MELQQQNAALESHREDDSELLRVAKDVSDTTNSGDLAVYQWYFQAAGKRNFALFLILCSLFVVGSTYPRMIFPPFPLFPVLDNSMTDRSNATDPDMFYETVLLTVLLHRDLFKKLDRKDPPRPEINCQ